MIDHDESSTQTIDVPELRSLLEDHRPVTVLDVRAAADRAEWSIPGSVHLDAYEALKRGDADALAALNLPADRPVVTVCGAGKVSLTAMERLRERGIDARSLTGGMKAWSLAWNRAVVEIPGSAATVIQVRRTGKGCLSYLIGSRGEAVVIDAALDPEVYASLAAEQGWTIAAALDTHVHADHLSRSRALADSLGATLYLPATDRVDFLFTPISDGETIAIGDARLTVIATPGHTPESVSILLDDRVVFTGDTLFLQGVGRPDLEANAEQARGRAHLLWSSLCRLTALPTTTLVLPGHTSAPVAFDERPLVASLAEVAARTPMLALDESAFVSTILARIPPTPPNHAAIVAFNEAGELPAGDPTDLEAGANRCAIS